MKNLKISKELIRAVLQKETETLSKDFNFTIDEDYIEISDEGEMQFEYCIYKFAFKCKEWAFNKMYFLSSGRDTSGGWCIARDVFENDENPYTEVEAIIKACEWVLENEIEDENKLQLQEDLREYNKMIREGI